MKKKNLGGGVGSGGGGTVGGGVTVDVNEELKFLGKFTSFGENSQVFVKISKTKKNWGGGGEGSGGASGWGGGSAGM